MFSNSPTVPKSKHQMKLMEARNASTAPGSGESFLTPCTILVVFDADNLKSLTVDEELSVPDTWKSRILGNPGLIYAAVLVGNRKVRLVPIEMDVNTYHSTFNSIELEGQQAFIKSKNKSTGSGTLIFSKSKNRANLSMKESSKVLDIGGII